MIEREDIQSGKDAIYEGTDGLITKISEKMKFINLCEKREQTRGKQEIKSFKNMCWNICLIRGLNHLAFTVIPK